MLNKWALFTYNYIFAHSSTTMIIILPTTCSQSPLQFIKIWPGKPHFNREFVKSGKVMWASESENLEKFLAEYHTIILANNCLDLFTWITVKWHKFNLFFLRRFTNIFRWNFQNKCGSPNSNSRLDD